MRFFTVLAMFACAIMLTSAQPAQLERRLVCQFGGEKACSAECVAKGHLHGGHCTDDTMNVQAAVSGMKNREEITESSEIFSL
ncbi:hypothetical protein IE53DRAFT_370418 [Violaceomyces palustris]|uniref:Uncharacterized protein n=1 Tax=Violaceomyces palustris TaxID=1673888 RepID=A0ACD0NS83_9BASI|nr:hypothetical protein IE53DRAFT_370418 [Violaceomyces palustris]